jgi:large subunit ribosomal protein L6
MSRIGKKPINIPSNVEIKIDGNVVSAKGPLGELKQEVHSDLNLSLEDGILNIERPSESKEHKSAHGLYRSLINNMVNGVSEGFKTQQELVGVGYRAEAKGQLLELNVGFSHAIFMEIPQEIKITTQAEKGKAPLITMESFDKQLLGQVAAKIRSFRAPEPYKGKGIKFVGEELRRKAGKTAAK